MMKALILSLCLLGIPAGLVAQDPGEGAFRRSRMPTLTDREIEEASQFMQENAPNRWQMIQGLPEEGAMRRGVMNFMVARYKSLVSIKEEDAELFEIKLQQLKCEDDVFGLVANARTLEERQANRSNIESGARRMMELNASEREHRIQRLKTSLAAEEERLKNDRANAEQALKHRVDQLISEGTSAMRRDMLPGRFAPRHDRATTQPARP